MYRNLFLLISLCFISFSNFVLAVAPGEEDMGWYFSRGKSRAESTDLTGQKRSGGWWSNKTHTLKTKKIKEDSSKKATDNLCECGAILVATSNKSPNVNTQERQ